MTDLNFSYDTTENCDIAMLRGYRIKAEQDSSPSNPFEDSEGNFPMLVMFDGEIIAGSRSGRQNNSCYEIPDNLRGQAISTVLWRYSLEQIVHWQVHLAKLLGVTVRGLTEHWDEPTAYVSLDDADALRQELSSVYGDMRASDKLEACAAMHQLLDIHAIVGTTRGYCQGDYAEVLVVATPEAIEKFGINLEEIRAEVKANLDMRVIHPDVLGDAAKLEALIESKVAERLCQSQIDLYGDWAWGNVYGYVIQEPVTDEDGEIEDWVEIDSCWGYYGTDHAKSGLAEAALACVPDEPASIPSEEHAHA